MNRKLLAHTLLTASLSLTPAAMADQASKSQFNTNIYQKESTQESFSAIVKVVREIQGDIQVFFEGQKGVFSIDGNHSKAGSFQELLTKSQKLKQPLQVVYDTESRQILQLNVGFSEPQSK